MIMVFSIYKKVYMLVLSEIIGMLLIVQNLILPFIIGVLGRFTSKPNAHKWNIVIYNSFNEIYERNNAL
jgi:hypothetical protein